MAVVAGAGTPFAFALAEDHHAVRLRRENWWAAEAGREESARDQRGIADDFGIEPQAGLADQLVTMKVQNLPKDYLETYTTKVNSVEPEQIQRVAKKYISSENSTIVVVGDAAALAKPLEKLGKFTVVQAPQAGQQ